MATPRLSKDLLVDGVITEALKRKHVKTVAILRASGGKTGNAENQLC